MKSDIARPDPIIPYFKENIKWRKKEKMKNLISVNQK